MKDDELVQLTEILNKLKNLKRTGWIRKKVPNSESVADHLFSTAALSLILVDDNFDKLKVIQMALLHDLSEALVGDITPFDGISKNKKHKMELQSFNQIVSNLPNNIELTSLFEEFLDGKTPEAKFVKNMDNLDMMLQAYQYEKDFENLDLQEFWDYSDKIDFGKYKSTIKYLKTLRRNRTK